MATSGELRPDVFISHSSAQREQVEQLAARLEDCGIFCWFAPRDIRGGQPYPAEIERGLSVSRLILLILTHEAFGSPHVNRELVRARQLRKTIVALRTDDLQTKLLLERRVKTTIYDWTGYDLIDDVPKLIQVLKAHCSDIASRLRVDDRRAEVWIKVRDRIKNEDLKARYGADFEETRVSQAIARSTRDKTVPRPERIEDDFDEGSRPRPRRPDMPFLKDLTLRLALNHRKVLILCGTESMREANLIAEKLASFHIEAAALAPGDAGMESLDTKSEIEQARAVVALISEDSVRDTAFLGGVDAAFRKPLIGVRLGDVKLTDELTYLLRTEQAIHASREKIDACVDQVSWALWEQFTPPDPSDGTKPNTAATVIGSGFLCVVVVAFCAGIPALLAGGLSIFLNGMTGRGYSPGVWMKRTFWTLAAMIAVIGISEGIKRLRRHRRRRQQQLLACKRVD